MHGAASGTHGSVSSYALVRAFHRPSRSEINSARCRSSVPSITLMSSGARPPVHTGRPRFQFRIVAARVVK